MVNMDLSQSSLEAIGALIDSRLAAALSELEGRLEARIMERLQTSLDERLAAIDSQHASAISTLENKVEALAKQNLKLRDNVFLIEDDFYELHDRLEDQEQRGRRYNVRIENIAIESHHEETEEKLSEKIIAELAKADVILTTTDIVRCHRSSKPRVLENGVRTAQTIVKVASWAARKKLNNVNRQARDKKLSIRAHHDLTRERLDLLQYARSRIDRAMHTKFTTDQLKTLGDNDKCFAFATINCDIIMRLNGSTYPFKSTEEFDDLFRDKFSL